jgi:lysophospholipase L1-like esterase
MRWQHWAIAACGGVLAFVGARAAQTDRSAAKPAAAEVAPAAQVLAVADAESPAPEPPARVAMNVPAERATPASADWDPALPEGRRVERKWDRPEEAASRIARANRLKSPGSPIEDSCRRWVGGVCVERALDRFFSALDELDAKQRGKDVTVVAMGNSLIAADGIVGTVRERLVERFGDGGKGFVYADRISDYGKRDRCGWAPEGHWTAHNVGMGELGRYPFAMGSEHHVSNRAGARARFHTKGQKTAEIFLLEHDKAPPVEVRAGEMKWRLEPARDGKMHAHHFEIPEGAKSLEIIARGKNAVVQGVALDGVDNGVVVDTVGIPAVDADRFLRPRAEMFREQLAQRDASLVMVMLGGVENRRVGWRKYGYETVEKQLRTLLTRVQEGAPDASCLVVGPIDATYGPLDEKVFGRPFPGYRVRKEIPVINEIQRQVATDAGCAYYDQLAAMGGQGSLQKWDKNGLIWHDLVHPRSAGLNILGDLLTDSLRAAWLESAQLPDEDALVARRDALPKTKLDKAEPALLALAASGARGALRVKGDEGLVAGFRLAIGDRFGPPEFSTDNPDLELKREGARVCAGSACMDAPASLDERALGALLAERLHDAFDASATARERFAAARASRTASIYAPKKASR